MDYEFVYNAYNYLNNVELFKHVHDAGIDLTPFYNGSNLAVYNPYGGIAENGLDNLYLVANHLFEIVEGYDYYEDVSNLEDIEYWNKLANPTFVDAKRTLKTIVILDDRINLAGPIENIGEDFMTSCKCDILPIEKGVVVVFDEDYGNPNWADVMFWLLSAYEPNTSKGVVDYEMAI